MGTGRANPDLEHVENANHVEYSCNRLRQGTGSLASINEPTPETALMDGSLVLMDRLIV
jgi:hypothetical protein